MKRMTLGFAAAIFLTGAAFCGASAAEPAKYMDSSLGKVLVDNEKSMTLYTYKPDGVGATKSTCVDKCIVNWPPFVAAGDAKAEGDWTRTARQSRCGPMTASRSIGSSRTSSLVT